MAQLCFCLPTLLPYFGHHIPLKSLSYADGYHFAGQQRREENLFLAIVLCLNEMRVSPVIKVNATYRHSNRPMYQASHAFASSRASHQLIESRHCHFHESDLNLPQIIASYCKLGFQLDLIHLVTLRPLVFRQFRVVSFDADTTCV